MCVETEHLQVCPERAYEMFTSSQTSVHSNSGSMSWLHSPHEIISVAGETGQNSRRKRNQS